MSTEYSPIYSNFGRVSQRVKQIDTGMKPQVLIYQQYIDSKVNNTLRSVLGQYDANGLDILLPLSGDFDVIDSLQNVIQLHMDSEIWMAADDCVIAKFRQDTAENDDKVSKAEQSLLNVIYTKYGSAVSVDQDFSTMFLAAFKFLWEDGAPIELEDGSGVLLMEDAPPRPNALSNSRIVIIPGPSL